jgi:tetratricopeptide (TPR) repeat protein
MKQTTIDMIVTRIAQAAPDIDIALISSTVKKYIQETPSADTDSFRFKETDIRNINVNLGSKNDFRNSNMAIGNEILGDLNQIIIKLSIKPDKNKIAIERFKLLPLIQIPATSSNLPSLQYNLPLDSNFFIGRDKAIEAIGTFFRSEPHPKVAVIHGMAGMGKSSLARNIAYRYGHYFLGGIFWISCSQGKEDIQNQLVQCARIMSLKTKGLNTEETIKRVKNEWQKEAPKLIIFDDCQRPSDLDEFLPTSGGGYVLITSKYQTRGWNDRCHTLVEMGQLSSPESVKLLQSLAPHLTDGESSEISTLLGDYPFALALAARYLKEYQTQVNTYLTEIKTTPVDHASLIGQGGFVEELPKDQRRSIIAMFELCYAQLKVQTERAAQITSVLQRLCYCAANSPLPVELLIDQTKPPQGIDAISDVINSGLLEGRPNTSVRMHALVAAFLKAKETDPAASQAAQDAVEVLLLNWAVASNDNEDIATFSAFAPHVSAAARRALERTDERAGAICFEENRYLALMSQYENALKYVQHAVSIAEHMPNLDFWTQAKWLNGLGIAHLRLGNSQDALLYFQKALYLIKDFSIQNNEKKAILHESIINNIGVVYDELIGDFTKAQEFYTQALLVCKQYLSEDHVHIARCYSNLGVVQYMQGQWEEAFDNYHRALSIYSQHYQPPHLRLAELHFNLGESEEQRRNYNESLGHFYQALSMFRQLIDDEDYQYINDSKKNIERLENLYSLKPNSP